MLDPSEWAAATKQCRNVHTFPVLAGDPHNRDVMLSSPILMDYAYPQVSPESPGDLFDATEIDEILSLRTLTLTDDEKLEARATDPRAAAIIDRVEEFPQEVLERPARRDPLAAPGDPLHGHRRRGAAGPAPVLATGQPQPDNPKWTNPRREGLDGCRHNAILKIMPNLSPG
ncbi:MAG TPA: hypothetical protein VJ757_14245 [Pseudonocardiaceae bacterium]|nr:hypothetical protein [Pseudonocardiaceae bacterium]